MGRTRNSKKLKARAFSKPRGISRHGEGVKPEPFLDQENGFVANRRGCEALHRQNHVNFSILLPHRRQQGFGGRNLPPSGIPKAEKLFNSLPFTFFLRPTQKPSQLPARRRGIEISKARFGKR